jgi:hypothetical protein
VPWYSVRLGKDHDTNRLIYKIKESFAARKAIGRAVVSGLQRFRIYVLEPLEIQISIYLHLPKRFMVLPIWFPLQTCKNLLVALPSYLVFLLSAKIMIWGHNSELNLALPYPLPSRCTGVA